jgi:ArsR family transcriptional regulator, arsenate/arsenite/antimonite-responsive transcriptional repressor
MESETAIRSLAALAQDTRLAVYRLLVQCGPSGLAAGEIAAQLSLAPATLSFHLKELSHAGLIRSRQEGRFIFYAADFAAMNALVAFLTENCCADDGVSCASTAGCRPAVTKGARSPRARKQGVKS